MMNKTERIRLHSQWVENKMECARINCSEKAKGFYQIDKYCDNCISEIIKEEQLIGGEND